MFLVIFFRGMRKYERRIRSWVEKGGFTRKKNEKKYKVLKVLLRKYFFSLLEIYQQYFYTSFFFFLLICKRKFKFNNRSIIKIYVEIQ